MDGRRVGAIFGLLASLLIIGRHIGANVTGILVILGINFAFGFFAGGISWQAHLGGAITGALVALIYVRTKRRDQRTWQFVSLAALVVLLIVVVAVVPPLILWPDPELLTGLLTPVNNIGVILPVWG